MRWYHVAGGLVALGLIYKAATGEEKETPTEKRIREAKERREKLLAIARGDIK